MINWCRKNNIIIQEYSPLGRNYNYHTTVKDKKYEHPLKNEKIIELAQKKIVVILISFSLGNNEEIIIAF